MEVYTPTSNQQECPYPRQQNVLIKPFDLCQSDSWEENSISVAFSFNVKFDKFWLMSANHSQDSDHIHHPQTFPPALYNPSLPHPRLPRQPLMCVRSLWTCLPFLELNGPIQDVCFLVCLFDLVQLLWDSSMFLRWWSFPLLLSGTPSDGYTLISLSRCLLMDICVVSSFWLSHIRPLWTFCTSSRTDVRFLFCRVNLWGVGTSGSESRCV